MVVTVRASRQVVVDAPAADVQARVRAVVASMDAVGEGDGRVQARTVSRSGYLQRLTIDTRAVEQGTQVTAAEPPPLRDGSATVVDPRWRWSGLGVCALGAGLTLLAPATPHRSAVLAAAAGSAVLWTLAVVTGCLRIRRRGESVLPGLTVTQAAISLFVGFLVADELAPSHDVTALRTAAQMAVIPGVVALARLVLVPAVRLHRRRAGKPLS